LKDSGLSQEQLLKGQQELFAKARAALKNSQEGNKSTIPPNIDPTSSSISPPTHENGLTAD